MNFSVEVSLYRQHTEGGDMWQPQVKLGVNPTANSESIIRTGRSVSHRLLLVGNSIACLLVFGRGSTPASIKDTHATCGEE